MEIVHGYRKFLMASVLLGVLSGCGDAAYQSQLNEERRNEALEKGDESIFDLFRDRGRAEEHALVNRYLWQASLETLSFLPLEAADPFSGLIITDWGGVAGGGTYRVTVLISDPALDAGSLKVAAFRQQGGRAVPVSMGENSQLEDAILTRARQLRITEAESGG